MLNSIFSASPTPLSLSRVECWKTLWRRHLPCVKKTILLLRFVNLSFFVSLCTDAMSERSNVIAHRSKRTSNVTHAIEVRISGPWVSSSYYTRRFISKISRFCAPLSGWYKRVIFPSRRPILKCDTDLPQGVSCRYSV